MPEPAVLTGRHFMMGNHASAEAFLANRFREIEITQFREGPGEPRDRGLRNAGATRQFGNADIALTGAETAKQLEPACKRRDELAVLALPFVVEALDIVAFVTDGHPGLLSFGLLRARLR